MGLLDDKLRTVCMLKVGFDCLSRLLDRGKYYIIYYKSHNVNIRMSDFNYAE